MIQSYERTDRTFFGWSERTSDNKNVQLTLFGARYRSQFFFIMPSIPSHREKSQLQGEFELPFVFSFDDPTLVRPTLLTNHPSEARRGVGRHGRNMSIGVINFELLKTGVKYDEKRHVFRLCSLL